MPPLKKNFKPSPLELEILSAIWKIGSGSIREIQESLPAAERPEYTTVQTIVYRLEEKGAVRRAKKIGSAHIFEALASRQSTFARLIEDFIGTLGGSPEPLVAHLVETGQLSSADLKQMEKMLKDRPVK